MGFISKVCQREECGRSVLSSYVTNNPPTPVNNRWLSDLVLLLPEPLDGETEVHVSQYDGYGLSGEWVDMHTLDSAQLWELWQRCGAFHRACWELSGEPTYSTPALDAPDQGFFIDPADFQLARPTR